MARSKPNLDALLQKCENWKYNVKRINYYFW